MKKKSVLRNLLLCNHPLILPLVSMKKRFENPSLIVSNHFKIQMELEE